MPLRLARHRRRRTRCPARSCALSLASLIRPISSSAVAGPTIEARLAVLGDQAVREALSVDRGRDEPTAQEPHKVRALVRRCRSLGDYYSMVPRRWRLAREEEASAVFVREGQQVRVLLIEPEVGEVGQVARRGPALVRPP